MYTIGPRVQGRRPINPSFSVRGSPPSLSSSLTDPLLWCFIACPHLIRQRCTTFLGQGPQVYYFSSLEQWRRPGAEFGGTEIFFADQDFRMTFFRKNFHFHGKNQTFLITFFYSLTSFSD